VGASPAACPLIRPAEACQLAWAAPDVPPLCLQEELRSSNSHSSHPDNHSPTLPCSLRARQQGPQGANLSCSDVTQNSQTQRKRFTFAPAQPASLISSLQQRAAPQPSARGIPTSTQRRSNKHIPSLQTGRSQSKVMSLSFIRGKAGGPSDKQLCSSSPPAQLMQGAEVMAAPLTERQGKGCSCLSMAFGGAWETEGRTRTEAKSTSRFSQTPVKFAASCLDTSGSRLCTT